MSRTSTRRILKAIEIRPITLVVASGPTLSAPRRSKRNQKVSNSRAATQFFNFRLTAQWER